ncbi:TPA: hypothetical protein JLL44_004694 [Escherichia coli]|nr:hypothetical protein [Escherichia coli]
MLWQWQGDFLYFTPCLKICAKKTEMTRLDYDFINLSLEHEMNEWLAERGYVGQVDIRTDSNQLFLFDSLEGM